MKNHTKLLNTGKEYNICFPDNSGQLSIISRRLSINSMCNIISHFHSDINYTYLVYSQENIQMAIFCIFVI